MKTTFIAASLFAVCLAATVPAMADEDTFACRDLSQKASVALAAAPADMIEARREARIGSQNCSLGYPKLGVVHYRKALELLGK